MSADLDVIAKGPTGALVIHTDGEWVLQKSKESRDAALYGGSG
jgi:hypothetical protein